MERLFLKLGSGLLHLRDFAERRLHGVNNYSDRNNPFNKMPRRYKAMQQRDQVFFFRKHRMISVTKYVEFGNLSTIDSDTSHDIAKIYAEPELGGLEDRHCRVERINGTWYIEKINSKALVKILSQKNGKNILNIVLDKKIPLVDGTHILLENIPIYVHRGSRYSQQSEKLHEEAA